MTESLRGRESQLWSKTLSDVIHVHFDVDVVTGDDLLPADRTYLDLHVDDAKRLGANVHLNETGVHRLVELAKPRDETNGTYRTERPVRHLERGLRLNCEAYLG